MRKTKHLFASAVAITTAMSLLWVSTGMAAQAEVTASPSPSPSASPTASASTKPSTSPGPSSTPQKQSIENATLTVYSGSTYSGAECRPPVRVKIGTKILTDEKDYVLSYENNIEPGTATVTVTGIGDYTGSQSAEFEIALMSSAQFRAKGLIFRAIAFDKTTKQGTASVQGLDGTNATKATIPSQVKLGDYTFTITEISETAFFTKHSLKSFTIGKNIETIGNSAFQKCYNLKKITIKTTKLKKGSIGKGAFSDIHKKATFKVPKKKFKAYKSLLKKSGAKKAKFKKI